MNTLDQIVPLLNDTLNATPLANFYQLRRRLKHLAPHATRHGGLLQEHKDTATPFGGYAFHWGGRGELQFNVGFEDDRYFRYGVAFSLEPSQYHPDPLTTLKPRIASFNAAIGAFAILKSLRMWSYDTLTRHDHGNVAPIPDTLLQPHNFIFIGERVDAVDGVTPAMLERAATVMASLLPVYEHIETDVASGSTYKVARLCWNTEFWQLPSGRIGKATKIDAFENQHGFGHEEWLFDFTSLDKEGWKYGFVQALNRSHRRNAGKTLNLLLYTIDDRTRHRYWVASIRNVQVLDEDQASQALAWLSRSGTLKLMREQVSQLRLNPASLDAERPAEIVNLRYRPADLTRMEPPIPFEAGVLPADYYGILQSAPETPETIVMQAETAGTEALQHDITERRIDAVSARRNAYVADAEIDLVQKRWQLELGKNLPALLPKARVHVEASLQRHAVDIIVEQNGWRLFVELKTRSSVRQAIREALGQLLEYSCWPPSGPRADALLIVAAGIADARDEEYLALLRGRFAMPVHYLPYRDGRIPGIAELIAQLTATT